MVNGEEKGRGQAFLIVDIGLLCMALLLYGAAGSGSVQDLRSKDEVNSLEVITCNLGDLEGYHRLTSGEAVDFFKLCGVPDVLLLQEVESENEAEYFSNKLGLKYFVFFNDFQKNCGMAILSGLPLLNPDRIYFKTSKYGYGAVAADVMVGVKKVQVVNVHMDRIDSVIMKDKKVDVNLGFLLRFAKNEILGDSVRSQSAQELMQWLGEKKADHVIMGGDFNSVPFSKTIRIIGSRFDDALWPSFKYLSGTYKRLNFPVAPRIDFLFLSSNLQCRQASVLPLSPGDHFPVRANVEI